MLCLFLACAVWVYRDAWRSGPREHLQSYERLGVERLLFDTDQTFLVWQLHRNARALVSGPHAFFDPGICHPTRDALAYTSPMLTLGVLAIPAAWMGAGPVLTFNLVLVAQALLAAFAMYWLVTRWSGEPAAGVVAALLYAFPPLAIGNPVHPHVHDTTWMVFTLGFAERLFAEGRWRDAAGLAGSAALQIGTDFYPLVASSLVALPLAAWLLSREQLRHVRLAQLGFVAAVVGLAALFALGPYVGLRAEGGLPTRPVQHFAGLGSYAFGGRLFLGLPCLVLAASGLALPRRRVLAGIGGDPRWALLAGGLLAGAVAAGPGLGTGLSQLGGIDLWGGLSALLPGFANVRSPRLVAQGVHLAACVLAGLGFGGLVRAWRWPGRAALTAALIAGVAADTLWLGVGGAQALPPRRAFRLVPDPDELAFFAKLAAQGNVGPIFEMPLRRAPGRVVWAGSVEWIFRAGHHGRRTSSCFGAAVPDRSEIDRIEARLPEREALRALRRQGFTTLVFHRELDRADVAAGAYRGPRLPAFEREAQLEDGLLERILEGGGLVAFAIRPDPPGDAPGGRVAVPRS